MLKRHPVRYREGDARGRGAGVMRSILLVDDDLQFVRLIRGILQEQGYIVYCGFDGNMAIELAQAHRPDLILMDVSMPFMDGLTAFRRLREDVWTAHIPVIFVTEAISQILYPVLDADPRSAHLKKPLDPVDLTSLLHQFLERYAA